MKVVTFGVRAINSIILDNLPINRENVLPYIRVNVSKYQNLRTRRQVVDFFIFCLNKPYGKFFSKNALKGSAALWFCQNRGKFEIRHFRCRPRWWHPLFD